MRRHEPKFNVSSTGMVVQSRTCKGCASSIVNNKVMRNDDDDVQASTDSVVAFSK